MIEQYIEDLRVKIFIFLCSMMYLLSAYAQDIFPYGCKPVVLSGDSILIQPELKGLVMLHNLSKTDIWITGYGKNKTGVVSNKIAPGLWSALSVDKVSLRLNCIESRPGHEQHIACLAALAVCEWPSLSRPEDAKDVFWGGENKALGPLTAYLGRLGFVLPSVVQ